MVRADIIPENPFMSLTPTERIKVPESKREFLTVDEIKILIATEYPRDDVKRAYLFACYCGLRHSTMIKKKKLTFRLASSCIHISPKSI